MASNSSSDYSDYDDSDNFEISDQDSFNIVPCSIPINFALFMNPAKMSEVKINESFLATVTSRKTTQLVKVIPSQECSPDSVLVPKLLQRTLDASVGDKVAITGYDTKAKADAIQVVPLFDTEGVNYKNDLIEYFKIESHPISILATFSLLINGAIRIFRIVNIIQIDRCCTTSATRIVLIDPKDLQAPHMAVLSRHFCDLALPSEIHNHISKYIFLPLQHQRLLRSLGVRSSNGVIFYGEAGTGKTSVLIAISREAHVQSLTITAPELLEMPVDQAFTKLQQGFQYVLNHTPAMLLIDDIGIIAGKTDSSTPFNVRRLRSYFVSLLDRSMQIPGFVIVATAQSQNEIDPSLIRFGRFGFEATLELPPSPQRAEILKLNMQGINIDQDDIVKLAGKTLEGKSCANVESVAEIGVCNLIRKSVADNRTYPLDDEIIKACTGHLNLEDFPVNIVDNGSGVGNGSSGGNAVTNEGLPSNQGGLSLMDMMGGATGSGQADLGPSFGRTGSGGGVPQIDDSDDFFDTLSSSIPKQAGTTTGMPDLDDSMFLGQSPPQDTQAPKSTGGILQDAGSGSGTGPNSNGNTDMFGRPIQSKDDVDMFGRAKSGSQPPVTDEMFSGFGATETNNNTTNNDIVPDNQQQQQQAPPPQQQQPQPSQQPDSQPPQNDPFANFGSSDISSNPFATGDAPSQPPQQSSQPQTPQQPQQSSLPTQPSDPFANFGSTEISSNPFASGDVANIKQPNQNDDLFGTFGGSGGFGTPSQQPANPFGQQQQQAGSQPTSLPQDDAFSDFRSQGQQNQFQNESGGFGQQQQAGSQPTSMFGGQQEQQVADPFGSFGNSSTPQNPFGAPQDQPQPPQNPFNSPQAGSQGQPQPQNPFGAPQDQPQPPQNPFNAPQSGSHDQPQPQNPFGAPQDQPQPPQNPFNAPQAGSHDQPQPQNPFGAPQDQPQPQNPFNSPQAGSHDQPQQGGQQQDPFGLTQQQQPPNSFSGPQQQQDPFGLQQQQPNSFGGSQKQEQPNSFGGPQQQDPFGLPQQQQPQQGSFGGPQQQQPSSFGGQQQQPQQPNSFGGPQQQQQQQDPFGLPQQQQQGSFGGPQQQQPNSLGGQPQPQDPFGPPQQQFGGFGGQSQQPQDPFAGPQQNSYGGFGGGGMQQGGFGGFQQQSFQSTNIVLGGGSIYDMFNSSSPQQPQQNAPQAPQEPLTPMYKPNVQDSGKQSEIIDIFGDNAKARKQKQQQMQQQQQQQQQQQMQQQNMQAGSYGMAGQPMNQSPMYNQSGGFGNYGGPAMNSGGYGQNYGGNNYSNGGNIPMNSGSQFNRGGFGGGNYNNSTGYNASGQFGGSGFGMGPQNNQYGGMGQGSGQYGGMGPGGNQFGNGINNNNNGMGAGGFGGGAPAQDNSKKDDPFSTYNPF